MIKFKIHPTIWEGEWCKFGKVLENVKIIGFFEIFWDILNKLKDNLGLECVRESFYPSRAKLEQFSLTSLEK